MLADSLCHANAICQNSEGSFTCTCAEGYEGDGTSSCQGRYIDGEDFINFEHGFFTWGGRALIGSRLMLIMYYD